jgi:1-acyl-sn-glycerol-3-phosphate acyltransferase
MRLIYTLRTVLLIALLAATLVPYSFIVVSTYLIPVRKRFPLARAWTRFAIWAARVICGVHWRVEGWENLPTGPAILLPKHQSAWETFWLPSYMPHRLSFVYKRELHHVPFFGWALASMKMINIDRAKGIAASEQVLKQGIAHLRDGWWIVIFPEGTRTPPGSTRHYKTGGVRLAVQSGTPVVPIAHNSGEFWPRGALTILPGEITVSIGSPIAPANRSVDAMAELVESWIETEMRRLAPHRYDGPYVPRKSANESAANA